MNANEFRGWDDEQAEQDAKQVEEGSGKAEFFKPVVGRNVLRFLPAPPNSTVGPIVVTSQHFIELPGRPKVVFNCPRIMAGTACPACLKAEQLRATQNPADRELAYQLSPRQRILAQVIDRAHPEKGPLVYGFGKTVFDALNRLRKDPDVGDFTRVGEDGFDIIVERSGTGKNDTEYSVRPSVKSVPLGDLSVLNMLHDLSGYKRTQTFDELVAKLRGDKPPQGGRAPAPVAPVAAPVDPWAAPAQPVAPTPSAAPSAGTWGPGRGF